MKKIIPEDKLQAIQEVSLQIRDLQLHLGALEVQKSQLVTEILSKRSRNSQIARKIFVEQGIDESDLEKYRIDISKGEIIEK